MLITGKYIDIRRNKTLQGGGMMLVFHEVRNRKRLGESSFEKKGGGVLFFVITYTLF